MIASVFSVLLIPQWKSSERSYNDEIQYSCIRTLAKRVGYVKRHN